MSIPKLVKNKAIKFFVEDIRYFYLLAFCHFLSYKRFINYRPFVYALT